MRKETTRAIAAGVMTVLILAACEEGQLGTGGPDTVVRAPAEARVEIVEVERPDVFSATELALWDGRPSLGGIWVAHPDVVDPERVRITNTSSGQTINGALFRRERQNPGPRIQVSSDAAAALGVLAGQPTELSVVVLRQEEVVIEPAPVEEPDEPVATDDAGEVAVTATAIAASASPRPEKKPGFWASLRTAFGGKPAEQTGELSDTDTFEATAAPVPDVETDTLDPIVAATAALDAVEAAEQAPRPAEPAPSLRNPFIQVGLFSQEENANAAASSLRQGGIVPTVVPGTNDGGRFWRVIVGPVSTAQDQAEILAQVRALGYADAFLSPN